MMYNRVFLIGNLAKDPDVRHTPAGVCVSRFTVAVNRQKRAGAESEADFIQVVAWRKLAEICGEYLKKGKPVAIEGKLQVRAYKGKDGQMRIAAEVIADNMQMLGGKRPEEARAESETADRAPF